MAVQLASTFTYQGQQGHLATIADSAEDQFVFYSLLGGPLGNTWLGGYQDTSSPSFSEPGGGWRWITSEPFNYTNWHVGEPNNGTSGNGLEQYLGYWHFPSSQWNDYPSPTPYVSRFVVEFDSSQIGTTYCSPSALNSTMIFQRESGRLRSNFSSISASACSSGHQ